MSNSVVKFDLTKFFFSLSKRYLKEKRVKEGEQPTSWRFVNLGEQPKSSKLFV